MKYDADYDSKYDRVILHEETITDEERIMMMRNPELQQYLPKSQRPPVMKDKDFFDFDNSSYARLHAEHLRRLDEDFAKEADFYNHVFLDDKILNEKYNITNMSINLKAISNEQANFGFVLGGSMKMRIDTVADMYTLKFKRLKLNNFKGLRLPHVDFTTPGYEHIYYSEYNDILLDIAKHESTNKDSVLVSLLYQPKLDFRPFDFGFAVLFVDERIMFVKYGQQEHEYDI